MVGERGMSSPQGESQVGLGVRNKEAQTLQGCQSQGVGLKSQVNIVLNP